LILTQSVVKKKLSLASKKSPELQPDLCLAPHKLVLEVQSKEVW